MAFVGLLRNLADTKKVSVVQITIARVAAQGEDILPIVGARRRRRLDDTLGAPEFELTSEDLAMIAQAAIPS